MKRLLEPDVGLLALELILRECQPLALIVEVLRRFNNRLDQVVFLGDQLAGAFIEQKAAVAPAVKVIGPQLLLQNQLLLLPLQLSQFVPDGLGI